MWGVSCYSTSRLDCHHKIPWGRRTDDFPVPALSYLITMVALNQVSWFNFRELTQDLVRYRGFYCWRRNGNIKGRRAYGKWIIRSRGLPHVFLYFGSMQRTFASQKKSPCGPSFPGRQRRHRGPPACSLLRAVSCVF